MEFKDSSSITMNEEKILSILATIKSNFNEKVCKDSTIIREAIPEDYEKVKAVTNDAFMADAFFKLEQFKQRFTIQDVEVMSTAKGGMFLVAIDQESNEVCGSIYATMHWKEDSDVKDTKDRHNMYIIGKFSAVAVPNKFGGRGIGRALVKSVEQITSRLARAIDSHIPSSVEMGVINLRPDLFPWYEAQGYSICEVQGESPSDDELRRIVLPGMDVHCILMSKKLSTA